MKMQQILSYLESHTLSQKVDLQTAYGEATEPERVRLSFTGAWQVSAKEAAAVGIALACGLGIRALRRLF
jgi:hypothetical protein